MEKQAKSPRNSAIAAFFDKPAVRIVTGLVGLGLSYVFGSWAIDSGSLLDWTLAILWLVFGIRELFGAVGALRQGKAKGQTK